MADDADAADRQLTTSSNDLSEPAEGPTDSADTEDAPDLPTVPDSEAGRGQDPDADGDDSPASTPPPRSGVRTALVMGLVVIVALAGLAGWLGYRADQSQQVEQQRQLFLHVAREGALNLTTISYTEADADIQRILDSSTGTFYDDFKKRSAAFVEVVKRAQSKTEGSIREAGLESMNGDSARVLVAVSVKTSNLAAADQQPRNWRMRIDVQKVGDGVKVSNVGFVP